jgi:aryl-alcohol dehydrogenase-like predicted oxidoreductase
MERRRLGRTDIELSVVGLGTWVFGGRWGGADDADSLAACHAALDAGVNWIDTADIYGQGRAERVVGKAVRERRDEVFVATKGGVAWELEPQFKIWREASREYLHMSVDRSLRALGLDVIDLYQVHWPVSGVPAEETISALVELRDAGKVRAIGVSNYHLPHLQATEAVAPIDSYQPGYHMLRPDIEEGELGWCAEHGVGVIAYGPLAHGLLTGKMDADQTFPPSDWRAGSELFTDGNFATRVQAVEELDALAKEWGRSGIAELAVAWVLRRPEVTSAIVGARNADQAAANAALAGAPLSAEEEAAVEEVLARHPGVRGHYGHGEPPDPSAD